MSLPILFMTSPREDGLWKDGIYLYHFTSKFTHPMQMGPRSKVVVYNFGSNRVFLDSGPTNIGPWIELMSIPRDTMAVIQYPGLYLNPRFTNQNQLVDLYIVEEKS